MLGETGTPERGGFILKTGEVVELENRSENPTEGMILGITAEHLDLMPDIAATWHTHPGVTANLSVGDSQTFVGWPELLHAIVGTDGVRWYGVKNGAVINA